MPTGNQNKGCCIYITHKGLHIHLYACVHIYAFIWPYIITFIAFTFNGANDLQIGLAINLLYLSFKLMFPNIIRNEMFAGTQSCNYFPPSVPLYSASLWSRLLGRMVTDASPGTSTLFGTWSLCSSISAE